METHGHPVALIAMEELDEGFCRRILGEMRRSDRARVFSSREHDASKMAWLLRGLRLLTTSRYHAAILSLAARVPQIAVGHDLRLSSLYEELGLQQEFFLRPSSSGVFRDLEQRIDFLLADPTYEEAALSNGYREHLDRAERNRTLLRSFLAERGWEGSAMGRLIFLTGGTGFIGTHVAKLLLDEPDMELVVLVFASDPPVAEHLLARAWWDLPDLGAAIGKNVHAVAGDVRSSRLGLPDDIYRDLVRRVDVIIHAAADLRLDASIEDLRRTNVEGVRHVLEFAREIDAVHGLQRFVHVSTAYVAGGRSGHDRRGSPHGPIRLPESVRAEQVRRRDAGPSGDGGRPADRDRSAGHGRRGLADRRHHELQHGLYTAAAVPDRTTSIFPMRPGLHVNVVPVDHVAQAIARMAFDPAATGSTFHLTAPIETLPTARELVNVVRDWA